MILKFCNNWWPSSVVTHEICSNSDLSDGNSMPQMELKISAQLFEVLSQA